MKLMSGEHFAILRRHTVETIGIESDLMADELGKTTLDERVLATMLKVPLNLFPPARWRISPMKTRHCRLASARRSPNPSSPL